MPDRDPPTLSLATQRRLMQAGLDRSTDVGQPPPDTLSWLQTLAIAFAWCLIFTLPIAAWLIFGGDQ